MTMKLTIKNEDAVRTAQVTMEDFAIGKANAVRTEDHVLEPNRSLDVWIHAARRIIIIERPP